MAISFNTGATASANTASSVNITIPAGVLVNDVMIMALEVFTETSTAPTISFSGAGGSWTAVPMNTGTNPETATAGSTIWSYGFAYYRVATAGDQGATLTITESGSAAGTTWFAVALAAYTGASTTSPIDVAAGNNGQGTQNSQAGPTINTVTANDWALQLACVGINGTTLSGPATSRENIVSSAFVGAALDDGNAAVAAGTNIGGGTWSQTGNTSNWWSLFTIGLAPPSGAAAAGKLQPWATVPVPRRRLARAIVQRITGLPPPATPNKQPPLIPRPRPLRRAFVRFITGLPPPAKPNKEPPPGPRPRPPRRAFVQHVTGTFPPAVTLGTANREPFQPSRARPPQRAITRSVTGASPVAVTRAYRQPPGLPSARRPARAVVLSVRPPIPAAAAAVPSGIQDRHPGYWKKRILLGI